MASASRPGFYLIQRSKSRTAGSLPAVDLFLIGAPGKTRTCNLLIRSQMLYPIKLRVRASDVNRPFGKGIPVRPRRGGAF